jgi:hypothetical protein
MRSFLVISLAACSLALTGCATISQEACQQGDWTGLGFKDGQAGRAQSRLDDHAKACAKSGVTPDPAPYFAARAQGLRLYCTPERGFQEGRRGHSYAGVCPEPAAGDFVVAYSDGRLIHEAETRLRQAESDRASADRRAEKRDREARGVEDELRNPVLNDEQKRELRDRLNRLRSERRDAIEDGRRADWAVRDAEREVSALEHRFRPIYRGW